MTEQREILTASAMNTLVRCPREYYLKYELGIRPEIDSTPLVTGTAWHNAMEARWHGKSYEEALDAMCKGVTELDENTLAGLSALLAGYYKHYGEVTDADSIKSEIEFRHEIKDSQFDSAGRVDCIQLVGENAVNIIEHKTTGEDISDDSGYWDRLRYNTQLYQYYLGIQSLGYDIESIIYDVTRKPTINPKNAVPCLDEFGRKIVLDTQGNRVANKNGEPRQSESRKNGYWMKTRPETPEEYSERLFQDIQERPEFYFQRREVPILLQDVETFINERIERGEQILHYRTRQQKVGEAAWARNVTFFTCRNCAFSAHCLQNVTIDVNNLPPGFKLSKRHAELTEVTQ